MTATNTLEHKRGTCACGCGRSIHHKRRGTKYYDATCRKRAARTRPRQLPKAKPFKAPTAAWHVQETSKQIVGLGKTLDAVQACIKAESQEDFNQAAQQLSYADISRIKHSLVMQIEELGFALERYKLQAEKEGKS